MIDEYLAFEPVAHKHEYEDVPEFELQAYGVAEIFAEKLRAIFQRGAPRDYFDLFQLLETGSVDVDPGKVFPAFEAKCDHDDLVVDLRRGLPEADHEDLQREWNAILPDLTANPPDFDEVWMSLNEFVTQPT